MQRVHQDQKYSYDRRDDCEQPRDPEACFVEGDVSGAIGVFRY